MRSPSGFGKLFETTPLPQELMEHIPPVERDEEEEEEFALRARLVLLRLSDTLHGAANKRSDLSPFLMEALNSAMQRLILYGDENDLVVLEEWLDNEERIRELLHHPAGEQWNGIDRRSGLERRASVTADRRSAIDRRGSGVTGSGVTGSGTPAAAQTAPDGSAQGSTQASAPDAAPDRGSDADPEGGKGLHLV